MFNKFISVGFVNDTLILLYEKAIDKCKKFLESAISIFLKYLYRISLQVSSNNTEIQAFKCVIGK